jgi:hypothetical protein
MTYDRVAEPLSDPELYMAIQFAGTFCHCDRPPTEIVPGADVSFALDPEDPTVEQTTALRFIRLRITAIRPMIIEDEGATRPITMKAADETEHPVFAFDAELLRADDPMLYSDNTWGAAVCGMITGNRYAKVMDVPADHESMDRRCSAAVIMAESER